MRPSVDAQNVSIVLVGKLNPAIISPAWLAKNALITDAEMDAAKVNIIHEEICQFAAGGYVFDITQQRFLVRTSDEPFVKVLDLVVGMFGEYLVHTPIEKLGINFEVSFACRTAKQRMAFGRELAPVEPWAAFGQRMLDASPLKAGGLVSLTMQENPPGRHGYRRVEIQPIADASHARVKISVNDHFEVADLKKLDGAKEILDILQSKFESSLAENRRIVGDLIDRSAALSS